MVRTIGVALLAVELECRLLYIRTRHESTRRSRGVEIRWLIESCLLPLPLLGIDIQEAQCLASGRYPDR